MYDMDSMQMELARREYEERIRKAEKAHVLSSVGGIKMPSGLLQSLLSILARF